MISLNILGILTHENVKLRKLNKKFKKLENNVQNALQMPITRN